MFCALNNLVHETDDWEYFGERTPTSSIAFGWKVSKVLLQMRNVIYLTGYYQPAEASFCQVWLLTLQILDFQRLLGKCFGLWLRNRAQYVVCGKAPIPQCFQRWLEQLSSSSAHLWRNIAPIADTILKQSRWPSGVLDSLRRSRSLFTRMLLPNWDKQGYWSQLRLDRVLEIVRCLYLTS